MCVYYMLSVHSPNTFPPSIGSLLLLLPIVKNVSLSLSAARRLRHFQHAGRGRGGQTGPSGKCQTNFTAESLSYQLSSNLIQNLTTCIVIKSHSTIQQPRLITTAIHRVTFTKLLLFCSSSKNSPLNCKTIISSISGVVWEPADRERRVESTHCTHYLFLSSDAAAAAITNFIAHPQFSLT